MKYGNYEVWVTLTLPRSSYASKSPVSIGLKKCNSNFPRIYSPNKKKFFTFREETKLTESPF